VLRDARPSTRTGRAAALTVYFQFLELRHKIELHNLTGRVIECPLDEMNRPRATAGPQLRVPSAEAEIEQLFAGWREELSTCRKFAPAARNYLAGMSLFAIQELLGHAWTGTTAQYIHVHSTHVEDAWAAGQQRAADRW